MPSNQTITIDSSNNGQTFAGNNNQYLMSAGAWSIGVSGLSNTISGGTGPNSYVLYSTASAFSQANSLTTGSGGASINVTGDWTQIAVPNPENVSVAIAGNDSTFLTSDGTATAVMFGNSNNITGGSGADTFLLSGAGSAVTLGGGTDAVGLQGDGLVTGGGGTDTFAFLAGSSATGPVINSFNPAVDHLSVLLSTGYYAGLTDTGLSPQAFLNPALFTEGSAPTSTNTRFLYDPSTGALSFTPYGSASTAAQQVATLPTGLTLSGSDIFISNRYVFGAPVQNALDSLPGAWNVTDPLPTAPNADYFGAADESTGVTSQEPGQPYSGPVTYLQQQLIYTGTHNVNFTAKTNNVFMKSGSGEDALAALGGQNVLDGGTNSNFLVGGTGTDTFFTDARTSATVWNTIVNFHPGDMVTLYGFIPGQSSYSWAASDGAQGYMGLTLDADIQGNGQISAKVTLTGLTTADLSHLAVSTGNNGVPYLAIGNT